jgi:hypothetical protein
MDDVPPAIDRVEASFRLSMPLIAPPKGMVDLAEFAGALAGIPSSSALRTRADEIFSRGEGSLHTYADGKEAELKGMTADIFWKALNEGAEWKGQRSSVRPEPHFNPVDEPLEGELPLIAIAAPRTPDGSPLLTKIYQESNLRLAPNRVALSPSEASTAGVRDGSRAVLQTRLGKCAVVVTVDAAVPAGAVQVGGSPGIQDVCDPNARAKVVSA